MTDEMTTSQLTERVRQAVIRRGCSVTVGDIISETGLGYDEAKHALDQLIATHEGTLRVSEKGDLLYAFSRGFIRRDYRSWWERNKELLAKIAKTIFKVVIFLVLVVYFILYLVILITLLTASRNNERSSSSGSGNLILYGWYFFWGGRSDYDYVDQRGERRQKKTPIYTRVYNFVLGPEEKKLDPLQAKAQCAQLIRARRGVITLEDWVMVSGQSREKCSSDLARYTAEFEGTAEITPNGSLVYVFENVMKSVKNRTEPLPAPCWKNFESPRPLSGNINGGDGFVIGLNTFNLIMAGLLTSGMEQIIEEAAQRPENDMQMLAQNVQRFDINYVFLGAFPLAFSILIFAVPLIRLPFNIKENRRRRQRNIRKALIGDIYSPRSTNHEIVVRNATQSVQDQMLQLGFSRPSTSEVRSVINDLCDEFNGEMTESIDTTFVFKDIQEHESEAKAVRSARNLDKQDLGEVVYSTNAREQERIEERQNARDLENFDRELHKSRQNGDYDANYANHNANRENNRSRTQY